MGTYQAALPFPIKGGKLYLTNNNPLLIYGYPGITGMKTGYTMPPAAAWSQPPRATACDSGAIVLNSTNRADRPAQLLNRGFYDVYHLPPVPSRRMPPGA